MKTRLSADQNPPEETRMTCLLGQTCLLRPTTLSPWTFFSSSFSRSPLLQHVVRFSSASLLVFMESSRVWLVFLTLSSSNMEALLSFLISSRSSKWDNVHHSHPQV